MSPSISNSDRIELRRLRCLGWCGASPEERNRAQPIEIDLDVMADLGPASRSDALADTIDYGAVTASVALVVADERFTLLEALAARIADEILKDDRVTGVGVSVRKLRPPVEQHLETSGVHITRGR